MAHDDGGEVEMYNHSVLDALKAMRYELEVWINSVEEKLDDDEVAEGSDILYDLSSHLEVLENEVFQFD